MAEVTRTGVEVTGLAEYLTEFQQEYRRVFGAALEFEAGSVQQQQIGVLSTWGTIFDEGLISVANALSLEHSVGYQLDEIGYQHGILRRGATSTTVELTLSGLLERWLNAADAHRQPAG